MQEPNEEQKRAIECPGNVLLAAGAGSGKTYVLVEHIIFLTQKFIEQKKYVGVEDFLRKIKKYFSGIVLITFTRKSTAEIRLRVKKRMEAKVLEEEGGKIWESVLAASPLLNISTIHGFCSLLLKQGFFPGFGRNFEIMSDIEGVQRIDKLFVEWFKFEKEKDSFKKEEKNYEIIAANRQFVVAGLVKIFNDPSLRNKWKNFQFIDGKNKKLNDFMKEYLSCMGLDKVFVERVDVDINKNSKKWELLLKNFYELADQYEIGTVEGIEAFEQLLSSVRIIPPRKTQENAIARECIKNISKLKNFLKDHKTELIAFEECQDKMNQWVKLFGSVFKYIENEYRKIPQMSYADLEYYVFEGLKNQKIADKISNLYQYIVVDEFQDTSDIQFEIIKKIVQEDYKKIFCVGDYKQAIYGFRGGEISVFERCKRKVENNLELACNFRSEKAIVDFNNDFFNAVLNCGDSFENICADSGKKKFQYSNKEKNEGFVLRHKVIVSDKTSNVQEIEALKIFNLISSMKKSGDILEVAILYKKLAPSRILREHLLLNKIPFVAQVKISYGEDFTVNLCTILLEFYLMYRDKKDLLKKLIDYPKFMILACFEFLSLKKPENLDIQLKKFLSYIHLYGFESAFCGFIYDLGISNSNYSSNVKIIKDLHSMFGEDLESIYNFLKKHSGQKYSIDVHFGEKGDSKFKVIIMTVHSSKGLEFEHVILGGIDGDRRDGGADNYIGKHPYAIKWKASSRQKRPFRSPEFILEKYISSQKDFAESKRLLYVACTRAVKGLHWVDVSKGNKKINDKKWAWALRKWCDLSLNGGVGVREDFWEEVKSKERSTLKLFGWGVVERERKNPSIILPEISVSGLLSIVQCPRKFYLQNVCRFKQDSGYFIDTQEVAVSSAGRGTELHEKISNLIENNWKGLSEVNEKKEREIFYWVKDLLSEFYVKGVQIFSEISVKFSFFGQFISGTADLVLLEREQGFLEIWDFKTGRKNELYWFQLYCYAYGFALKYGLGPEQNINMAIAYIDKRDIVRKTMSLSRIQEKISKEWGKTDNLNRVNEEHCPACFYRKLCHSDIRSLESEKY